MNNETNKKKSDQLGMPHGTANAKLRKMIIFRLAQECSRDDCYQCGLKITDIDNFSIEHKEPWLDVDPDLFWNWDNIAFSHLTCNIGARRSKITTVCHQCKINPPRRDGRGHAKECGECNTRNKQAWRERTRLRG